MNVCVYEYIFIYAYGSQRTTGQSSTFLETGLLDLNLINYSRLIPRSFLKVELQAHISTVGGGSISRPSAFKAST